MGQLEQQKNKMELGDVIVEHVNPACSLPPTGPTTEAAVEFDQRQLSQELQHLSPISDGDVAVGEVGEGGGGGGGGGQRRTESGWKDTTLTVSQAKEKLKEK